MLAVMEQSLGDMGAIVTLCAETQPELPIFKAQSHALVVAFRGCPGFFANERGIRKRIAIEQRIKIILLVSFNVVLQSEHTAIGVRKSPRRRSREGGQTCGRVAAVQDIV